MPCPKNGTMACAASPSSSTRESTLNCEHCTEATKEKQPLRTLHSSCLPVTPAHLHPRELLLVDREVLLQKLLAASHTATSLLSAASDCVATMFQV